MAKQYVKSGTSLVPVSEDKIRNYESLDCVKAAIQRGELTENDLFTTVCNVQAICDDLAHELYRVISYIPADTNNTDNKLLNHCDISGIGGNTDVQVGSCVNHASDGLVDITQSVIDAVYPIGSIYMNATSASVKPVCGTWTAITGKMLLGTDASYALGTCGGSATITLETCQLPEHYHGFEVSSATIESSGSNTFSFSGCTCCCCFTPSACVRGFINSGCTGEHTHAVCATSHTTDAVCAFAYDSGRADWIQMNYNSGGYPSVYTVVKGSAVTPSACDCYSECTGGYISVNGCHRHKVDFDAIDCNQTTVCFSQIELGHITVGVDGTKTVSVSGTYAGEVGNTGCTGNGCSICVLNPYQAVAMWYRNA